MPTKREERCALFRAARLRLGLEVPEWLQVEEERGHGGLTQSTGNAARVLGRRSGYGNCEPGNSENIHRHGQP